VNPVRFVRGLPQPVRTVFVLVLVGIVATMVEVLVRTVGDGRDGRVPAGELSPLMAVTGGLVLVMGVLLVLDVAGSARAFAAGAARDESVPERTRAVMGRPVTARVYGAMAVVVGTGFLLAGTGLVT
jgi:hypothetical protein